MNDKAVTHQTALAILEKQDTPESKAIVEFVKANVEYVQAVRKKDIAALGTDEAFILRDGEGQIKAFKKAITLSQQAGTLVQPVYKGDLVVSAQGYEALNEATGTSVIFPKEVLVGGEWKPNPYAERDPNNRRILAVHARAIAFKYSSMGIPQVSDWTTIFDTPSYRMIDLLAKAKNCPQAFKVLPTGIDPGIFEDESTEGPIKTWAHYPFDESMNLWINTSHDEVIKWLSQILNREKKAMDFAQTFAKRNASKHIHGIQKAPCDNWRFAVLAWRPTGNNIVKWDASQYEKLQDRVAGMIQGGGDEFTPQIELQTGNEKTSEEENIEVLEAETDPEDNQDNAEKPAAQETSQAEEKPVDESPEMSKDVKQADYLAREFPAEFSEAVKELGVNLNIPIKEWRNETAVNVCQKVADLVDQQN